MTRVRSGEGPADNAPATRIEDDDALLRLTGLMTLANAARRAGTTPETLRQHLGSGECRGRKIGGKWYVSGQAIGRWASRRTRRPVGRPPADGDATDCPCGRVTGGLERGVDKAQLEVRAARVRALGRMQENERQVAIDILGSLAFDVLPQDCCELAPVRRGRRRRGGRDGGLWQAAGSARPTAVGGAGRGAGPTR